jgi:hypothetical protein
MSNSLERRRHKRYRFNSVIEIRWTASNSKEYFAVGTGVDISVSGMAFEVSVPISVGTLVSIQLDEVEVLGKSTNCL